MLYKFVEGYTADYTAKKRCIALYTDTRCVTALHSYTAQQRYTLYSYTALYTIQPLQPPSGRRGTLPRGHERTGERANWHPTSQQCWLAARVGPPGPPPGLESAVRATGPLGPWRAPVWPGGQYRTSWRTYAALFTPDHSRHDVLYSVWYSVHGSDSLFFAR